MNVPAPISLCMIVRNEATHLARCLDSVRGLIAELIVVDTGSTDGTAALARDLGARVIETVWTEDFSHARNLGLAAATQPWILVLDADEWLLPADEAALRARTGPAQPRQAYTLLQASASSAGPGELLVAIVRLFPNDPRVRYEWPIHEQVITRLGAAGIAVAATPIRIQHSGYADATINQQKQRRNLTILQRQEAGATPPHPLNTFLLAGAYLDVGEPAPALAAYRRVGSRADASAELVAAARLREATCLLRLGQPQAALAALPDPASADPHPEIFAQRAAALKALGRTAEAAAAHERVLAGREAARIPPCNLLALKAAAAGELALHWRPQHPALAIALLRTAKATLGRGEDFDRDRLLALYREHGVRSLLD